MGYEVFNNTLIHAKSQANFGRCKGQCAWSVAHGA